MDDMSKLLVKNGRVLDPISDIDIDGVKDLLISNGRIAKIGTDLKARGASDLELIDATGLLVVPGLIDMHVHLREPGREDEETIESGSLSALKGGFTSIACMPNTKPVIDSPKLVKYIIDQAIAYNLANVLPIGSITVGQKGEKLAPILKLIAMGAVAISDDGKAVKNAELMRQALALSAGHHFPVIEHCEDEDLSQGGAINKGQVAEQLRVSAQPSLAEEVIVARDIILAEATGGHIHIAHVSSARSVELIRWAKKRKVKVTAEVTPHHFTLTEDAVLKFGTNAKMNPPLRTKADVEAVIEGLKDDTIDAIVSDHAPHTAEEKAQSLNEAPFGIIGLETTLALTLTQLVNKGHLSLSRAISKLSHAPAKILNLDSNRVNRGRLCEGAIADITIIDLEKEVEVNSDTFCSKSRNTPFFGRKLKGWPVCTIVKGEVKCSSLSLSVKD